MSNQLQTNLDLILEEKNTKLLPENLKSGVTVLGITGTLEQSGGIDTSDATATADDIVSGKSAYVNGEKVEGAVNEISEGSGACFSYKSVSDLGSENGLYVVGTHSGTTWAIRTNAQLSTYIPYTDLTETIGLTSDKLAAGNTILGVTGTANIEDGVGLIYDLSTMPSGPVGAIRIHVNEELTEFYNIYKCVGLDSWETVDLTNVLAGDEYTQALAISEDILDGPDEEPDDEPEDNTPIICFEFTNGPIKQLIIPETYAPGGGQMMADETNMAKAQITMTEDFTGTFTVYNADYGYTPVLTDDVGTTESGITVTGGNHTETDTQYYYWSPMDGIYVEFTTCSYLMYDQILGLADSVRITLPENNEVVDDGHLDDEAEYLVTFASDSSDIQTLDNGINVANINVHDNLNDISLVLTDLVSDIQGGEYFTLELGQSNGDEKDGYIRISIDDSYRCICITDPTSVNSEGDGYNNIWFCINHPAAMMTMNKWIRIDANGDFVDVTDTIHDIDFSSIFNIATDAVVYVSERLRTTANIKAALQAMETIFGTTLEMGGNG